jgi:hypothetical protein
MKLCEGSAKNQQGMQQIQHCTVLLEYSEKGMIKEINIIDAMEGSFAPQPQVPTSRQVSGASARLGVSACLAQAASALGAEAPTSRRTRRTLSNHITCHIPKRESMYLVILYL